MLNGKTVLIVGAAGLIGAEIAEEVYRQDGKLVIADIDSVKAKDIADNFNEKNRVCHSALDFTSEKSFDSLFKFLENKKWDIDAIVISAYPQRGMLMDVNDTTYSTFCEAINLHLGGYYLSIKRIIDYFQDKNKEGSVVSISSIYGNMAPIFELYEGTDMKNSLEYGVIKAGINQMTKYFAQLYKKDGIRINAIAPGGIRENQPEIFQKNYDGRSGKIGMLNAKDITGGVTYLISEHSKAVTGQVLTIDDGFSL